ncbi:MAG: zinc finger domain-containing protein, partial [Variovorax sp.]|nr:zinc finger domain-containing protein [Variovorax sp.]
QSQGTIFFDTFAQLPAADEALLARWSRVCELRNAVNKEIETVREAGRVGSSLQATVKLTVPAADHALLASLGEDLRFVLIVSAVQLLQGDALAIEVTPATATKCERCWHYRDDVGSDAAHPTLCGRCTSNLFGAGEARSVA